jgi:hypothetical protein
MSFDVALIDGVLPLVPGLTERLEAGIDVADVGCGQGHAIMRPHRDAVSGRRQPRPPTRPWFYAFSLMHCMTVSLALDGDVFYVLTPY